MILINSICAQRRGAAFIKFTALLIAVFIAADAIAGGKRTFGDFGGTGYNGQGGPDGNDGVSIEIHANGKKKSHMLSGGHGGNGSYGEDGGDAHSCRQPNRPNRNLRAASGGDGGEGGAGGRGGHGGNITIFYKNIDHLRNITVISDGGSGGYGGQGGRGGDACGCQVKEWTVRNCEQKKNDDGSSREVCENNHKFCVHGEGGQGGSKGSGGRNGDEGTLYIVKDTGSWVEENIQESILLSEISDDNFTFHQHFFTPQNGARNLLSNGSLVQDEYLEYRHTDTAKISLSWNSSRPQSTFTDMPLTMHIHEGDVRYNAEGALVAYSSQGQDIKAVSIDDVVLHEEAQNVEITSLVDESGSKLLIKNGSEYANLLETSFTMQYYSKVFLGWKVRFERELSPQEWVKEGSSYSIDLASLGMKKKFIKKGKKIKVKLSMNRALGDDVLIVELTEKLKLGTKKKQKKKKKKNSL